MDRIPHGPRSDVMDRRTMLYKTSFYYFCFRLKDPDPSTYLRIQLLEAQNVMDPNPE